MLCLHHTQRPWKNLKSVKMPRQRRRKQPLRNNSRQGWLSSRSQREPRWKYSANVSVNGSRRKKLGKRKRLRRELVARLRKPPRRPERKLPKRRQLSCKRASRMLNSSLRVRKSPWMPSNRSKLKNVSLQANLKRIPAPVMP